MAEQDKVSVERDVRLDLFRGIGLWMIFLDHIPHDVVSWLTLRNYGFSDAAEFFEGTSESKPHWNHMVASVPLVLTFVKVPAAI